MALGINDVIILKSEAEKRFDIKIHMHDSCAGQAFTAENPLTEEQKEFITDFLNKRGLKFSFTNDSGFSVR